MSHYEFAGSYRPCLECKAPITWPPPLDGWMDIGSERDPDDELRAFATPHLAECWMHVQQPENGMVVRVQNRFLTSMKMGMG